MLCRLIHGTSVVTVRVERKVLRTLDMFIDLVKRKKGLDLQLYRKSFLSRRLRIRMTNRGVATLSNYSKVIEDDPGEWDNFLQSISINVSVFFRDPVVFDFFDKECLGKLIERKRAMKHGLIRVWSVGCSFGEEPYSLAIFLKQALAREEGIFLARVWATDIDEPALSIAKKGEYEAPSLKNIDQEMLQKYFVPLSGGRWKVSDTIRPMVTFRQHNIFSDPPLKYMDIIFFRNVRIYFDAQQAEKVLLKLYHTLRRDGYLVIGKTELLPASLRNLFVPIDGYYRIFQKARGKGG